jgi:hypothetical protein
MPTETQTAIGDCPTHGEVQATRDIPRITFPPIYAAMQRALAMRRRPYRCPTCGAPVGTD